MTTTPESLSARLRAFAECLDYADSANLVHQAADLLDRQAAIIKAKDEALDPFARMANEDTAYLPDEHVITLTYDDSELDDELGGPNTLLGEPFMRAFRIAATARVLTADDTTSDALPSRLGEG